MKTLLCLAILIVASFSFRDLQKGIYEPFEKSKIQEVKSSTTEDSNEFIDPFKSANSHSPKHKKTEEQINQRRPQFPKDIDGESFEERKESRKQYNQNFNETLKIGLFIGSIALALILIKTCIKSNNCNRRRQQIRQQMTYHPQPYQNQPMYVHQRAPQRQSFSNEIAELEMRIENHKNEISKLNEMKENMMYKQIPSNQQSQMLECSSPNRIQFRNQIPVGRPLPRRKDNDSSFASEYPVL